VSWKRWRSGVQELLDPTQKGLDKEVCIKKTEETQLKKNPKFCRFSSCGALTFFLRGSTNAQCMSCQIAMHQTLTMKLKFPAKMAKKAFLVLDQPADKLTGPD
jgi:hypothetical protein